MIRTAERRQSRIEADRAVEQDHLFVNSGFELIPRGEVVEDQPPEPYRAPNYLKKTAGPALAAELDGLLGELRAANQEQVGEKVVEVEAYYAATGLSVPLRERIRDWCGRYFAIRADRRRLNPRHMGDPALLAGEVLAECAGLLVPLRDREGTVNVAFLNLPLRYVRWLIYGRLCADLVAPAHDGYLAFGYDYEPLCPSASVEVLKRLADGGWLDNGLPPFLADLKAWAGPALLERTAALPREETLSRLKNLAGDIQAMRPLLVRNFRPEKTAFRLTDGCWVAWKWQIASGIAHVIDGSSERDLLDSIQRGTTRRPMLIDHAGLLSDGRMSWRTAADEGGEALALNLLLLEELHRRLFEMYDRIDFARLRRPPAGPAPGGAEAPDPEELIAAACRELAEEAEVADAQPGEALPAPAGKGRRLRPLRWLPLRRLLGRLGCEVRPGKGSEVVVYRPGGRQFILGHHKANPEIHPAQVARLLARVGVGVGEFLSAIAGG